MESLSWGKLKDTVLRGIRPGNITVQVIASKKLKDDPLKHRLLLWDGCVEYMHALYVKRQSNDVFPQQFSVIRVADDATPEGLTNHLVRPIIKNDGPAYAFIFFHYTLVNDGSTMEGKINGDLRTPGTSSSSASTTMPGLPGVKPKASPDTHTPASPLRQKNVYGRSGAKRNLVESYSSSFSEAKRAKSEVSGPVNQSRSVTHQIADLNPYQKYTIKAKVTHMKNIRQIQTQHFQGQVIDCILTDLSGDVKLTAWKEDAGQMVEILQNNKIFFISGCRVKYIQDSRYNKTAHKFELEWCQNTRVDGPLEDEDASAIPTKYKFVPLAALPQMEANTVVDVAGWVKHTEGLEEFTSRNGKELKKRVVTLADDSNGGTCVNLTLWGDDAVQFASAGRVITVKYATVGEWNGGKTLSVGFTGSYEVEPAGVWGVADLVEWAAQLDPNNNAAKTNPFKTIQEIKEEMAGTSESKRFSVTGYIVFIKSEEGITYRAHQPSDGTRCMKKVVEGNSPDTFKCTSLQCQENDLHHSETTHRYNMQLCIADATSSQDCVAFDAAGRLTGKSATEVAHIAKEDLHQYEELINKCLFKQFIFVVSAKTEKFRDEEKLRFTIHSAKEVVWEDGGAVAGEEVGVASVFYKEHVQRMEKEVVQMEGDIGESHEELYGITWEDELTQ